LRGLRPHKCSFPSLMLSAGAQQIELPAPCLYETDNDESKSSGRYFFATGSVLDSRSTSTCWRRTLSRRVFT
jgi:hypothetical protein